MCFQEFNSSGTFTPSAALLAAGGVVQVFLVAGGGGSGGSNGSNPGGAGGGGEVKQCFITLSGAVSVVVGAGGAGGLSSYQAYQYRPNGGAGGASSFGSLSAAGGGYGFGSPYSGSSDCLVNSGNSGAGFPGSGYWGNDMGYGCWGGGAGGSAFAHRTYSWDGSTFTSQTIGIAGPGVLGYGTGGTRCANDGAASQPVLTANKGTGGGATLNGWSAAYTQAGSAGFVRVVWFE